VLQNFNGAVIDCEKENEFIYKFFGTLKITEDGPEIPLDEGHILLRGSSLRNTKWIYGVAVYTGHDSKVMMNSSNNKPKFSKLEKHVNRYIILGIGIQSIVCLIGAILNSVWELFLKAQGNDPTYLELNSNYDFYKSPPVKSSGEQPIYIEIPINFGKWFLAMMNFVAISLLVSLEMVKFA